MEEGHLLIHSSYLESLLSIITGQALSWMLLCVCCCYLVAKSCLFVTPGTVAGQAPLSMRFPRKEYWRGLPFPPPGDFSRLLHWQADSLPLCHQGSPTHLHR